MNVVTLHQIGGVLILLLELLLGREGVKIAHKTVRVVWVVGLHRMPRGQHKTQGDPCAKKLQGNNKFSSVVSLLSSSDKCGNSVFLV